MDNLKELEILKDALNKWKENILNDLRNVSTQEENFDSELKEILKRYGGENELGKAEAYKKGICTRMAEELICINDLLAILDE